MRATLRSRMADGPNGVDSDCAGNAPCGVGTRSPPSATTSTCARSLLSTSTRLLVLNFGVLIGLAKNCPGSGPPITHRPASRSSRVGSPARWTCCVRLPRVWRQPAARRRDRVHLAACASIDAELRARAAGTSSSSIVGGRWEDLSRFTNYDVRGYGSTLPDNAQIRRVAAERPRDMHDAFSLWAGVEQVETGDDQIVRLGARLGVETSSLDDERTSALHDRADVVHDRCRREPGHDSGRRSSCRARTASSTSRRRSTSPTARSIPRSHRVHRLGLRLTRRWAATRYGRASPSRRADGTYGRLEQAVRFGIRYGALSSSRRSSSTVPPVCSAAGRCKRSSSEAAGAAFAIAGRDAGKLDALGAELAATAARAAHRPDRRGPSPWCARSSPGARVVINCAGPLGTLGEAGARGRNRRGCALPRSRRRSGRSRMRPTSATNRPHVGVPAWSRSRARRSTVPSATGRRRGPRSTCVAPRILGGDLLRDTAPIERLAADRPARGHRDQLRLRLTSCCRPRRPAPGVRAVASARGLAIWRRDRWEEVVPAAERRRINAGVEMGGHREVVSFLGGEVVSIPRHIAARRGADLSRRPRAVPPRPPALRFLAARDAVRAAPAPPSVARGVQRRPTTSTRARGSRSSRRSAVASLTRVVIEGSDHYRVSDQRGFCGARRSRCAAPIPILAARDNAARTPRRAAR